MRSFPSLVIISSVFMLCAIMAMNTASHIIPLMHPPRGEQQFIKPAVEDPQDIGNVAYIFAIILLVTAGMLYLLKKKRASLINGILLMSFLTGTTLTLSPVLGDLAILASFLLVGCYAYELYKKNRAKTILSSFVLLLTLSGVGAYLGVSLGIVPALMLIIVMAVYDYVAVFVTKHMVELARGAQDGINMMFVIPVEDRAMGLGAGDIALPTAFIISVFAEKGISHAIPTAMGGLMGIIWIFYYILDKRDITLPALPPIVCGLILGYALSLLALG